MAYSLRSVLITEGVSVALAWGFLLMRIVQHILVCVGASRRPHRSTLGPPTKLELAGTGLFGIMAVILLNMLMLHLWSANETAAGNGSGVDSFKGTTQILHVRRINLPPLTFPSFR